jgi:hypothetical protein
MMVNSANKVIIPCSGSGKTYGTLSRKYSTFWGAEEQAV